MRRAVFKALAPAVLALACAATLTAPTAASAQEEAIPTAMGAPGNGAPPAPQSGPLRLSDHVDQGPDVLRPAGPCGAPAVKEDGKPDRGPHGEVWAGVGTRGYRDIGGVVCQPLGDNGALSIAVDAGQIDGWGRRR